MQWYLEQMARRKNPPEPTITSLIMMNQEPYSVSIRKHHLRPVPPLGQACAKFRAWRTPFKDFLAVLKSVSTWGATAFRAATIWISKQEGQITTNVQVYQWTVRVTLRILHVYVQLTPTQCNYTIYTNADVIAHIREWWYMHPLLPVKYSHHTSCQQWFGKQSHNIKSYSKKYSHPVTCLFFKPCLLLFIGPTIGHNHLLLFTVAFAILKLTLVQKWQLLLSEEPCQSANFDWL